MIDSLGYGGAERLLVEMLPHLKEYGVQPTIISLNAVVPLKKVATDADVKVISLNFKGSLRNFPRVIWAAMKLRYWIKKTNPDIVHSHLFLSDGMTQIVCPSNVNLVTTLHNIDSWWSVTNESKINLKKSIQTYLFRKRSPHCIAVSTAVAVAGKESLKLSAQPIKVVLNGINFAKFTPSVPQSISNQLVIVQIGRFYPQKGHSISISALQILKRQGIDCKLILVGSGPEEERIRNEIASRELTRDVEFVGNVDDVSAILGRASIYWMPSTHEGLPIACIEAMAMRVPVIVSEVGGLKELVEHGISGFLIPPGNPDELARYTVEVASSNLVRDEVTQNAYTYVKNKFDIKNTAKEYSKYYSKMFQNQKSKK